MSVQINVAANQAALTASIQAGVQAYNQRFAQNNQLNLTINPRAFSQPLGRITGDVKDFEAALAASNARVIAFGASTAVLGGVIRSFKELANVTIEVEKNLADINRVFGLTTSQLQKFSTDLFNVTKQTASSFNDASQAALEFSRQGLKAEETLQRTKDALTLTRLAGISTANAVDALTSTVNGFAATGITTSQILNKLVAVEQDFAVGAGDLAEALSRTGQAAQEAGVSLDQLNALVTSAQQSTARGGAVIGNALKTIFTRLQRTDTLDQLEAFNISVRDVQGNILPAVTILQNFAGAYQNLADAQRAQLSEQVAGVYQVNILKAIVNDLNKSQGVYAGALQRGAMATNEAEVATAKLNQTLDALLKQTATSTQQLANNIGKVTFEPLARYGTEQLKSLVESMNEILEGEGIGSTFANGLLKGIRNILAGPGAIAAFFTLFKLIQNSFTYLSQALPQIAGITTETQNRKNIEQSILQIMAQQGPVAQALAGTMGNQAAQAQLLLQVARQQTAEYQTQTALARQLAAQLAGQGVRVRGSGGLQVTRAGGYIPASTKMAEVVGAQAGGYSPGRVVASPVGGVMNTAEDVKYIPGFAQPFINPPARSKAGRAHRQNAINRTGVDPYMFSGFIPNFVKKSPSQFSVGRAFEQSVGFDIKVPPSRNKPIDFKEVLEKPINKNFNPKLYQSNTFADAHSGLGHTSAENISKVINHIGQNYYAYSPKQGSKTKRLKIDDKTSIISQPDLLGDLFIRPRYTEIIGEGSDVPKQIETSSISSLNTTAKKTLLNGVSQLDFDRILRKKIKMQFAQDRVYGSGFIPNFAIPVDSARIPWFKKYASSYKNTASDKDVFRQIDFPTYGKGLDHNYAKVGNADMVSFLYEDFVRSAINIALGSKQVVRSKEAGFKHTPTNAISNRDPIDLTQKISNAKLRMIEVKQSKNNQKETISQISDAKLKGLFQENPELAKNVELMSIIFNDPRYVDPTGKNPAGVLSPFEQSIAPIVKNSYADVDPTMRGKLGLLTDGLLRRYEAKKNTTYDGFIPNFGKYISTKFFKTQTGPELFSSKGTGLSGTVYKQPGYKSYGYQLKEQLNNMVMSILGNNVFFPDASSLNPKIYGDVNKGAENSAKNAALKLSSAGKTSSLGLGSGMMSEAFGNSRLNFNPEAVYAGQISGKMKRVNYDRLSDVLGAFWSGNPQTKSAWESLKNLSESGKFEEKESIRAKTSLLKKAYEEFLIKNNYIGTRVKLSSYRKRAEGVEGVNYGSLRSDLAGVSDVRNLGKNNGFIPNFAMGDKMRTRMMKDNLRVIVHDLKTGKEAYAQPGKKGKEYLYHKDAYNAELKTSGANVNDYDFAELHNLVRGFIYPNGKIVWDYSEKQQEALKDPNIKAKILAKLLAVETRIPKSIESSKPLTDFQRTRALLNNSYSGFIPNFNFIKGRNSFQKNWLIETAKKRNLNLNDPNVFHQLATEFAKTYPNDQGMFGLSKGFIPNFAYKQSVMSLEENMSGNKAIFDTKPFPHIRNSSQPTFSSAISDHGGLSNALSDSMRGQKAAGLMSRGFVPNFAPRPYRYSGRGSVVDPSSGISQYSAGLGFSLADQERRAKDEFNRIINSLRTGAMTAQQATTAFATLNTQAGLSAKAQASLTRILNREVAAAGAGAGGAGGAGGSRFSRFSRGLSRAGTAISIAGPTIAGFAEQSFFGDRKRSEMSSNERMAQSFASTGLSAVTTGVGIGAQAAGLPGALIGGAVGGLIALKSALDSASLSIDELKEKKEEEKNKIIENISSAERYLAIQEEISKSTSPKDIKKNLISLRAELSSIKDADFANKIKVAGTDINSLSAIVQEYSLKQKEATSVLNDAILVQKKYSFETLKSAGILKIQKEGGTGALAQTKKFLSGGVNAVAQFFGIGGTKETELGKLDFADKRTRETVYKENPNLFKSLSKIDPNILVDIGNVFAGEVTSTMGFGGFATKELEDLLKKGGLKGTELDETVAVLKEAGDSSNYLGNTLADAFVNVVSGFSKYSKDLKKEEILMISAAEAVANLNQQLKDFINNLDYSFKDLSRQNEFEKNLRGVRQANTMLISESLYGKRDALQTQLDFDIEDVRSGTRTKELDISKKLLTTNIQDYYNLSDAQKTAYLQLSKSFDLSKPEENLKKIEGFIQTQFGTLDTTKAIDKQKDYLTIISNVRKDIAQTEKESADDLAIAAEKFKEALMAMELSRDFVFQFKAGFRDLATEGDQLIGTIGRQLPKMFADGLVDGIKAAIRESDNLGEALMGIASKFLDEISTMMMRSGIYQIVGAFAPSILQSSVGLGAITPAGKQKGGLIRAQSGMYVSGTGSGDKYPAMLENGEYVLNRNAVMAMGGPAALDTLNFSAAPRFASGGSFNAELSDIKAMEEGMTTFGLENSSLYKQLRDAEIQRAEQERQKKRARQAQTAQMVGSLVAAVATIGIGAGISNKMGNVQAGKAQNLSAKLQTGQPLTNAESLSIRGFMNKGLISTSGVYKGPEIVRSGFSGFTGYGRQTGGLIGSRLSDTIPGYMEGGLYNSTMVKKYGTGMQAGGMSPVANNNSNTVNNNNANNAFNFNTTVNRDGTIQMGANSTSYKQQDVELSNNLNNRIYGAVLDVIRDQQRFGGSLAGTRKA